MSYTCGKILVTNIDRHFLEIDKSCSGHPKTCKFIKNRKSKILTKSILSSLYIEESNNDNLANIFIKVIKEENLKELHASVSVGLSVPSAVQKETEKSALLPEDPRLEGINRNSPFLSLGTYDDMLNSKEPEVWNFPHFYGAPYVLFLPDVNNCQ